jgi:hypothetical protein
MPDRETWRFINTFAPWLSAMGSLSAVITALYLAQRDRRLNVRVRASIRIQFFVGGGPGHGDEFVSVNVVNKGQRPARIARIFWRVGIMKTSTFFHTVPTAPGSSTLPTKLEDGDEAAFIYPIDAFFAGFLEGRPRNAFGRLSRLQSFFMRVQVSTSTGRVFSARISRDMQREVVRRLREQDSGEEHASA